MLESVSEQQKRLKEQQIMIQQMLQRVEDRCRARSPQNVTAQVASALQNQSEPVTVALEPVVQDAQEMNLPDTPVVHEPFDQVVEKFPDMPAVLDEKPVVHEEPEPKLMVQNLCEETVKTEPF